MNLIIRKRSQFLIQVEKYCTYEHPNEGNISLDRGDGAIEITAYMQKSDNDAVSGSRPAEEKAVDNKPGITQYAADKAQNAVDSRQGTEQNVVDIAIVVLHHKL